MNKMTEKAKIVSDAEQFVRSVLEESFGQKTSKKTVKAIAEQVSRSIPSGRPKEGSGRPKRS